ncbi:solute carrier family 12 member 4-like isoform X5 [Mycteria americana]|uniref:solute carrier family 12 member 4-like isoform X5 n=1 Tax=Mycteria americana TaxID=33587 RepID=UPI003F58159E
MSGAGRGARPWRGGAEPSESSPEPPSPSSSRPPPSDTSPSPSDETTPPPHGPAHGRGGAAARPAPPEAGLACDRNLALFEEELATRPRVPALLRRIAPYSALSPDSDDGHAPRRLLGTLRGVAAPSLQTLLGLVLVLRLPWVVGTGGVLQATAIGLLLGACAVLTAVSLSAIATNGLDPGVRGPPGRCPARAGPRGAAEQRAGLRGGAAGAAGAGGRRPPRRPRRPPGPRRAAAGPAGAAGRGPARRPAGGIPVRALPARPAWRPPPALPHGPAPWRGGQQHPGGAAGLPGAQCAPAGPEPVATPPRARAGGGAGRGRGRRRRFLFWGPAGAEPAHCLGRSGELRDIARSVPAGSLGAAVATALGYLSAALLLGASVEGQLLRDKFGGSLRGTPVAGAASWPSPWVPLAGALLSAAGAGLQALLGGSRLLRGLARTRALPLPHALGRGRLWPLVATAAVAELGVLLGSLDLLAPVLSVFWLTSYLGVNLACALQGLLPTPGWSPRCRLYHWGVSLAGAGLCLGLMLVTCWYCALLALGIGATAYKYLEYRGAQSEWGEGLRGLSLSAARFALLRLEDGQPPAPSWRPQLLVLLKLDEELRVRQPQLLALAAQLQAGKGLTVVGSVIPGDLPQDQPRARAAERALREGLAGAGARGFVQVLVAPARGPGLAALVQGCGLGALRPNAVLMGWPHGWRRRHDPTAARRFVELLRVAGAGGRALLVAKGPLGAGAPGGTLDVWWVVGDGRLLTLLPLLLRQHPAWRGCRVRLFTVALLEDNSVRLRRLLEAVARRRGLPAQTHVVELHDSDVSAYTYERTLMMEQRSQMLRQMRQAQRGPAPSQAPSAGEEEEEEEEGGAPRRGPSPGNVRRMHAAERLNEAVGRCSGGARLVLLDLPPPPPPPAPPAPRQLPGVPGGADGGAGAGAAGAGG